VDLSAMCQLLTSDVSQNWNVSIALFKFLNIKFLWWSVLYFSPYFMLSSLQTAWYSKLNKRLPINQLQCDGQRK